MEVKLALLGFGLVAGFLGAVMSGRLSAAVGLILIPMLFAVLGGFATQIGPMVVGGLKELAPTATMLIFAILYFGVMIDVGLFNPIVRRVIGAVRGDPLRVTLGTAILALIVSLDGDGATTIMVTVTAFLPVYLKLKMRPMILAVLVMMANMVINIAPWGGPTARAAAALKVDPADIFIPLLPAIACGVLGVLGIAWLMGSAEKRRLAGSDPQPAPSMEGYLVSNAAEGGTSAAEKFFWFNLVLTAAVMVAVILQLLPLAVVFMTGFAVALLVNYRSVKEQRQALHAHAVNVVNVAVLLFAAAVFTGVLSGSGMVDAMARTIVMAVPESMGPYLAVVTAFLSLPLTFFMSNDAYYFGVLPVLAQTAAEFGVPSVEIARASVLGGPVHGLSPLVAATYLVCGMVNVELGGYQRFGLKWAVLLSLVLIAGAVLSGAVSLER